MPVSEKRCQRQGDKQNRKRRRRTESGPFSRRQILALEARHDRESLDLAALIGSQEGVVILERDASI
jgi:hypothetical protein